MRSLSKRKSSYLRFLVPGPPARIESSFHLVTGGRGSRCRVVCTRYRNETPRTHWAVLVCLAGRTAGCDETHTPRVRPPVHVPRDGKLCRGRPRRNVDDGPPRNWCRLSVLIFRDALTSLNRGQEDEPTELAPG